MSKQLKEISTFKLIITDLVSGYLSIFVAITPIVSVALYFGSEPRDLLKSLEPFSLTLILLLLIFLRIKSIKKAIHTYPMSKGIITKIQNMTGSHSIGIFYKNSDSEIEEVIGISLFPFIFKQPFHIGQEVTIIKNQSKIPWYKFKESPMIRELYEKTYNKTVKLDK